MALRDHLKQISKGGAKSSDPGSPAKAPADHGVRFLHVHPDSIELDRSQPRKDFGDLDGLRMSIGEQGILQPLIVSAHGDNRYKLLAGERRLAAARQLGMLEVPVLVRAVEQQERIILQIIENLHRKDLSPLEEAEGIRHLMNESGLSQRDAASRLGKSPTYINELLRVLQLPADLLDAVRTSEQPAAKSLLLEITKQPTEDQQRRLWQQAGSHTGLTVKQARAQKCTGKTSPTVPDGNNTAETLIVAQPEQMEPAKSNSGWSTRTKVGMVIVQLHYGESQDKKRIRQALEEAIVVVRAMVESARRSRQ